MRLLPARAIRSPRPRVCGGAEVIRPGVLSQRVAAPRAGAGSDRVDVGGREADCLSCDPEPPPSVTWGGEAARRTLQGAWDE